MINGRRKLSILQANINILTNFLFYLSSINFPVENRRLKTMYTYICIYIFYLKSILYHVLYLFKKLAV